MVALWHEDGREWWTESGVVLLSEEAADMPTDSPFVLALETGFGLLTEADGYILRESTTYVRALLETEDDFGLLLESGFGVALEDHLEPPVRVNVAVRGLVTRFQVRGLTT